MLVLITYDVNTQTAAQDGTNRPDRAADDYVTSQDKAAPSTADTRTQKQGKEIVPFHIRMMLVNVMSFR